MLWNKDGPSPSFTGGKMRKLIVLLLFAALISGCSADAPVPEESTVSLSETSSEALPESSSESALESSSESSSVSSSESSSESALESSSESALESSPESAPPAGITVSRTEVTPGGFVVVRAAGITGTFSFTDMFGVTRSLDPLSDGAYAAVIPVSASCAPGDYALGVSGGGAAFSGVITVTERAFDLQTIEFDDTIVAETINSAAANDEYNAAMTPLKYQYVPTQLWEGSFALPLYSKYNQTSSFGMVRTYVYTDGATTNRHLGIDMAVPEGTPVYASNSGKVLFAGFLQLTGNSVLIEHGYGIKTWYYHMSALYAETGAEVAKGQHIGDVGTTGFSTGPHLHFAASVNDVFIDPYILLNVQSIF